MAIKCRRERCDPAWPFGLVRYLLGTVIWECSAGRFRWHFGADETLYVIEGAVDVTHPDGTLRTLRAGDAAHFPAGVSSDWHVPEYVMKLSFLHVQPSLLRRVARRVPLARAVDRLRRRLREGS